MSKWYKMYEDVHGSVKEKDCLMCRSLEALRSKVRYMSHYCGRFKKNEASMGCAPHGARAPPFPLSLHFLIFCSFLLFPFLSGFNDFLLLSISFLSNRIVPLCFQAGGCRKRPNLDLVCCVYFELFLS